MPPQAGSRYAMCVAVRDEQGRLVLSERAPLTFKELPDNRVHVVEQGDTLWHLAGRWGRVRTDGVMLSLRLTHDVLADLVAARRPTVTSALSLLGDQGLVDPFDGGWLLRGTAPAELLALEQG